MESEHKIKMKELDLENSRNKIESNKKFNQIKLLDKQRRLNNKLQRNKIKDEHKEMMRDEEIEHEIKMKFLDNNKQIIDLKNKIEIKKNNLETEVELKKISNEIEINKLKSERECQQKIKEQEFAEKDALLEQEKEKLRMDMKFNEMMFELIIDKINNLKIKNS
jgi:hypothetical protein